MIDLAIISGSGFYDFPGLEEPEEKTIKTSFGRAPVWVGHVSHRQIAFIARHGLRHTHLPNMINFRANLLALKILDVKAIVSTTICGELEIPIALLGFGVDYANGVSDDPTPIEVLRSNLIKSKGVFLSILEKLIKGFREPRYTGFIYRFNYPGHREGAFDECF